MAGDRRLRRGTFSSVPELIEAIETWTAHRNIDPKPFQWHAKHPTSSKRYAEAAKPSHKSNPRRSTSETTAIMAVVDAPLAVHRGATVFLP